MGPASRWMKVHGRRYPGRFRCPPRASPCRTAASCGCPVAGRTRLSPRVFFAARVGPRDELPFPVRGRGRALFERGPRHGKRRPIPSWCLLGIVGLSLKDETAPAGGGYAQKRTLAVCNSRIEKHLRIPRRSTGSILRAPDMTILLNLAWTSENAKAIQQADRDADLPWRQHAPSEP